MSRNLNYSIVFTAIFMMNLNALTSAPVEAAPLAAFRFAGQITEVSDPNNRLGGTISVGSAFSGQMVYDLSNSGTSSSPVLAQYSYSTPPNEITATINGLQFRTAYPSGLFVEVFNNFGGAGDVLNVSAFDLSFPGSLLYTPDSALSIQLIDLTATAISSLSLPTTLSLQDWSSGRLILQIPAGTVTQALVIGEVTSLSAVPEPDTLSVAIDIKPGSFPNSINPRSRGKIPVAILTTGTFDATTVDPTTVFFGATGTEAAPVQSALEDVDGDGDTDMILHFNTQGTGIACGDTSASLTGETFGGQMIKGSDSINTVGCK